MYVSADYHSRVFSWRMDHKAQPVPVAERVLAGVWFGKALTKRRELPVLAVVATEENRTSLREEGEWYCGIVTEAALESTTDPRATLFKAADMLSCDVNQAVIGLNNMLPQSSFPMGKPELLDPELVLAIEQQEV